MTMSMPFLYNIEKFNNTVTIQSSVSLYTDVSSVLSFSITEGSIRLVSPDLKTLCPTLWSPVAFHGLSACVHSCQRSVLALCISTPTE